MTTEGYIFLILAWGTVLTVLTFCLYKVFTVRKENNKRISDGTHGDTLN